MKVDIGVPSWRSDNGPATSTPTRQPRSFRRTSSLDMLWPDGSSELRLVGAARDLYTPADSTRGRVDGLLDLTMSVDTTDRPVVVAATVTPSKPGIDRLIGHSPIAGFRKLLAQDEQLDAPPGSLLRLLLNEVPIASVVAWAALGRHGLLIAEQELQNAPKTGVCAGWRSGGALASAVARGYSPYAIDCPGAPEVERVDDAQSWHTLPARVARSMRRRRRMDVVFPADTEAPIAIEVFFRDSHVESESTELALHEYSIRAEVTRPTNVLSRVEVLAGALPSGDCPAAMIGVSALVGTPLEQLDARVRETLRGVSSCTHLNDVLLSLADLWTVIPHYDHSAARGDEPGLRASGVEGQ